MTMTGKISQGKIELSQPVNLPEGTEVQVEVTPVDSFWANLSAEELARRQNVQPIQSLDDLAGDWPSDDSIDDFLQMIREVRR